MMSHASAALRPPMRLLFPVLGFLALGYLIPGGLVLLLSLGHPPTFVLSLDDIQIQNFARIAESAFFWRILWQTVLLGVVVGVATAVFGYPVAYYIARSHSPLRGFIFFLTIVPMAVGMNMITLGWMVVLGRNGLINSALEWIGVIDRPLQLLFTWGSVVIGLVHVLFTFMVLPIASVLKNIDPALERAARNLGAGPVRTFLYVTLPLSFEGIAAGFLIVFMLASGALVLPLILGGQGFMILPIAVWEQFTVAADRSFAAALSVVLLLMALVVLVAQLVFSRSVGRGG